MRGLFAVATTMLFALCLAQAQTDPPQRGGRGRGAGEQQSQTTPGASSGQAGQQRPAPPPEEKSSATKGSVRIGGQQINYTATAATYVIKADDGSPKATFFFVAYTKDDVPDKSKRPLSFIYNGGPGSASSYTHMGLGPKRIVLTDDGFGMPAPYSIVENGDSFLDATDMYYTLSARVQPWDQGQPGQPAEALRSAMTQQVHLKLLVLCGYYDVATPFNGIEHTISHMNLEPPIRKNVSFAYYEAGHMMYIEKKSREKLRRDVATFINGASKIEAAGSGQ